MVLPNTGSSRLSACLRLPLVSFHSPTPAILHSEQNSSHLSWPRPLFILFLVTLLHHKLISLHLEWTPIKTFISTDYNNITNSIIILRFLSSCSPSPFLLDYSYLLICSTVHCCITRFLCVCILTGTVILDKSNLCSLSMHNLYYYSHLYRHVFTKQ